jgi:hypothetical protein
MGNTDANIVERQGTGCEPTEKDEKDDAWMDYAMSRSKVGQNGVTVAQ